MNPVVYVSSQLNASPSHQSQVNDLLRQRYGVPTSLNISLNETLEVLLAHRSVRKYADRPLPPGTLEMLCAAAQSASTSSSLQAWSVVAVQDPARKQRLSQLAGNQEHIRTCPLFLVWLADLARLHDLGSRRNRPVESLDFLESFLVAAVDASLAAQNASIAAESMGLGVVYIGGIRNQPEAVAEELGLPPHAFAVFGMCIGYPDPDKPAAIKPRLPQAAVLHHETYNREVQEEAVASYNEIMDRFYREQNMTTAGQWDMHSLNRVRGPEAMNGRHRLKEALNQLGFQLK